MSSPGILVVALPVVPYCGLAPDHSRFVGTCDGLTHPDDNYGVMVPLERATAKAVPALAVLDPLCPACKAFEQRLQASGFAERLHRQARALPPRPTRPPSPPGAPPPGPSARSAPGPLPRPP